MLKRFDLLSHFETHLDFSGESDNNNLGIPGYNLNGLISL